MATGDAETEAARLAAASWARTLDALAAAAEAAATGRISPTAAARHRLEVDRRAGPPAVVWRESVRRTRRFGAAAEVDRAARRLVRALLVRRLGWTVPESDGRVEADAAALLLAASGPAVRVEAAVGIDGALCGARLAFTDAAGAWRAFGTGAEGGEGRAGARYLAGLFRVPAGGSGAPPPIIGTLDEEPGQGGAAPARRGE